MHHCSECAECIQVQCGNRLFNKCKKYSGDESDRRTDWNINWIACRFFRDPAQVIQNNTAADCSTVQPTYQFSDTAKLMEHYECDGQISIFDYGGI